MDFNNNQDPWQNQGHNPHQQHFGHQQPPHGQYSPYGQPFGGRSAQEINNTGQVVFSIINIVFGNWILGIIAIIFAVNSKTQPTYEAGMSHLRTAKILNIVAVVLNVVGFVVGIIVFAIWWALLLEIMGLNFTMLAFVPF